MNGRLHTISQDNPMARKAALRMLAVWPLHLPARDTVQYADLRTSNCDCRVALSLALGRRCDLDGFAIPDPQLATQLDLFEEAA